MVRRHPRLGRDVRKQPTLIHKCAPHASPRRFVIEKLNHDTLAMARVFQQTVRTLAGTSDSIFAAVFQSRKPKIRLGEGRGDHLSDSFLPRVSTTGNKKFW